MQRWQNTRKWAIAIAILLAFYVAVTQWEADEPAASVESSSEAAGEIGIPRSGGPELRASRNKPQPVKVAKDVRTKAEPIRIRFTVLDWADDPVVGAVVRVNEMNSVVTGPKAGIGRVVWRPRVSGVTDEHGIVAFDAKRVNHPKSVKTLQWRVEPPRDREDLLLAGRGGMLAIESMIVRLSRGYVIAGTVLEVDGSPLGGLVVHYTIGASDHSVEMPITDEHGRFRFRPVPRAVGASYRLWVSAPIPPPGKTTPNPLENSTEAWGGEEHLEIVVEPIPGRPGYFRPARGR